MKDDYWGKILSVERWGMPSAVEETGDLEVFWKMLIIYREIRLLMAVHLAQ